MRIPISTDIDVVTAYLHGRQIAASLGFSSREIYEIAMAVSEVARNIVSYAGPGEVSFGETNQGARLGLIIVARDWGPGIADIDQAMKIGYSTGGGLGLGLPVAATTMDEFDLVSAPGQGTTVTMIKWRRQN